MAVSCWAELFNGNTVSLVLHRCWCQHCDHVEFRTAYAAVDGLTLDVAFFFLKVLNTDFPLILISLNVVERSLLL